VTEKILAAIKEVREKSKKRNFSQTFDLIIALKDLDLKKPENKFSEDFVLPKGRGENAKVVIFADAIKNVDCEVLTTNDINKLAGKKGEIKKLVKKTDFFLAEPKLMPAIGKALGQVLAPRGMMPKLITEDAKSMLERLKKSVRISVKDSPVIQCLVGKENMNDKEIEENVEAVLRFAESKLPKGKHNIKNILLKLTMSNGIKIEV